MASKKTTTLDVATIVAPDDLIEIVRDPSGTPLSRKTTYRQSPHQVMLYGTTSTSAINVSGSNTTAIHGTGVGDLVLAANSLQAGAVIRCDYVLAITGSGGGILVCSFHLSTQGATIAQSVNFNFASGSSYLVYGHVRTQVKTLGSPGLTLGMSRGQVLGFANITAYGIPNTGFDSTISNTLAFNAVSASGGATLAITPHILQITLQQPGQ